MPTAFLVSDVLQIISDLRGETSVDTSASRIRAVSRGERDFAKRRFYRMHLVKDQSIGTGDGSTADFTVGSATYPMRMKGVAEVFVGGLNSESYRRQVVDFASYKNQIAGNASANIAYEYFDQANRVWKVRINPAPVASDPVYASWYYSPPVRTLTTEYVLVEDIYIPVYLALADIYHGEDELQLEQLARQEAEGRIAELDGIEEAPAVNQIYTMPAIENSIRNRGIGTY